MRAVERYQGPWNRKLANKILIIGNKGDPITPLASAKELAELLGPRSAVLLERDGYGVSVLIFLVAKHRRIPQACRAINCIRFISAHIPCGGIYLHESCHYQIHGSWEVAGAPHRLRDE